MELIRASHSGGFHDSSAALLRASLSCLSRESSPRDSQFTAERKLAYRDGVDLVCRRVLLARERVHVVSRSTRTSRLGKVRSDVFTPSVWRRLSTTSTLTRRRCHVRCSRSGALRCVACRMRRMAVARTLSGCVAAVAISSAEQGGSGAVIRFGSRRSLTSSVAALRARGRHVRWQFSPVQGARAASAGKALEAGSRWRAPRPYALTGTSQTT